MASFCCWHHRRLKVVLFFFLNLFAVAVIIYQYFWFLKHADRPSPPQSVLVLGSGGMVGTSLVHHLHLRNIAVTEIVNRHHIDLRENGILEKVFPRKAFSFCFFLAFEVGGAKFLDNAENDRAINESNTQLYKSIFGFLRQRGIPFIFTSSQQALTNSTYGKMKKLGEEIIAATPTLRGKSVRLSNVYGYEYPGQRSHVIPDAIFACLTKQSFSLLTDGHEERQFIHSDDLAASLANAMANFNDLPNEFSITTPAWSSLRRVMDIVRAKIPSCRITFSDGAKKKARYQRIGEFQAQHILRPQYKYMSLVEGIERVIADFNDSIRLWNDTRAGPLFSIILLSRTGSRRNIADWLRAWKDANADLFNEEEIIIVCNTQQQHDNDTICDWPILSADNKGLFEYVRSTADSDIVATDNNYLLAAAVKQRARGIYIVFFDADKVLPTREFAEFLFHKQNLRKDVIYFSAPAGQRWGSGQNAHRVSPGFYIIQRDNFVLANVFNLEQMIIEPKLLYSHLLGGNNSSDNGIVPTLNIHSFLSLLYDTISLPLSSRIPFENCIQHSPALPLPQQQCIPNATSIVAVGGGVNFLTVVATSGHWRHFLNVVGSFQRWVLPDFRLLIFHCGLSPRMLLSLALLKNAVVDQSAADENVEVDPINASVFHRCTQEVLTRHAIDRSLETNGYVLFMATSHVLNISKKGNLIAFRSALLSCLQGSATSSAIVYGPSSLFFPGVFGGWRLGWRLGRNGSAAVRHNIPAYVTKQNENDTTNCYVTMNQIESMHDSGIPFPARNPPLKPLHMSRVCSGVSVFSIPSVPLANSPLFTTLLPSYVRSINKSKTLHTLYIGYDLGDIYWDNISRAAETLSLLDKYFPPGQRNPLLKIMRGPAVYSNVDYVWNYLFHEAYKDGCDFFLQLVDDVKFPLDSNWADIFADELAHRNPRYFGVTGHYEDKQITQPFVHRTHMEIWKSFYPAVFHNWYGDTWVYSVYRNVGEKYTKAFWDVKVTNTETLNKTRYQICFRHVEDYKNILALHSDYINKWLHALET